MTITEIKKRKKILDDEYRKKLERLKEKYRIKDARLLEKYDKEGMNSYKRGSYRCISTKEPYPNGFYYETVHNGLEPLRLLMIENKVDEKYIEEHSEIEFENIYCSFYEKEAMDHFKYHAKVLGYRRSIGKDIYDLVKCLKRPFFDLVNTDDIEKDDRYMKRYGVVEEFNVKEDSHISYEPMIKLAMKRYNLPREQALNTLVNNFYKPCRKESLTYMKNVIKKNKAISLNGLFEICKELHCSIDFLIDFV